jgi:hypothetical protein
MRVEKIVDAVVDGLTGDVSFVDFPALLFRVVDHEIGRKPTPPAHSADARAHVDTIIEATTAVLRVVKSENVFGWWQGTDRRALVQNICERAWRATKLTFTTRSATAITLRLQGAFGCDPLSYSTFIQALWLVTCVIRHERHDNKRKALELLIAQISFVRTEFAADAFIEGWLTADAVQRTCRAVIAVV